MVNKCLLSNKVTKLRILLFMIEVKMLSNGRNLNGRQVSMYTYLFQSIESRCWSVDKLAVDKMCIIFSSTLGQSL